MSPFRVPKPSRRAVPVAGRPTHLSRLALVVPLAAVLACEVVSTSKTAKGDSARPDSTAQPGTVASGGNVALDSTAVSPSGVAGAGNLTGAPDSAALVIAPDAPRRGGVVFALLQRVGTQPRCVWKGDPVPCYIVDSAVVVTAPLPADERAGDFPLAIDVPPQRVSRQVAVGDRNFGREIIFLDSVHYAMLSRAKEIAGDARAIRATLTAQTPERRWSGRWREPIDGMRSEGYGVERFYYRASDSSRSITLDERSRSRGTFATDTSEAALRDAPGWRHAGIDTPARTGTRVLAAAGGMVADVGDYLLSGRTILIDHGQGVFSAYFHLDTALVRKGDAVRAGRVIGRVGETGLTTGPHLHFGVYIHGKEVDPMEWMQMPDWMRGERAVAGAAGDSVRSRSARER